MQAKSEKEAVKRAEITIQRGESEATVLLSKVDTKASCIRAAYAAETAAFLQLKNDTLSNSVAGLLSYLGVQLIAENNNTVNVELEARAKTNYAYN